MIFWQYRYADGSRLLVHVANDGELMFEMLNSKQTVEFCTSLPRGAVEELKQFLSMKGF